MYGYRKSLIPAPNNLPTPSPLVPKRRMVESMPPLSNISLEVNASILLYVVKPRF